MRIRATEELDPDGEGEGSYQPVSETEYLIDAHNENRLRPNHRRNDRRAGHRHHEENLHLRPRRDHPKPPTPTTQTAPITDQTTHTFAHDGHGSVRVLLEAAAAIAQIYTYSAYGELLAIHNAQGEKTATNAADALTNSPVQRGKIRPANGATIPPRAVL